jgi:alpha/beta hydrolase family protein
MNWRVLVAPACSAAALCLSVGAAEAKLARLEVLRIESPAFEGRVFGTVGTYDKIVARATIAVDPGDPHNADIVDLALAPKDAQGLVEAVSEVEILRPTDAAQGNRRLFYEVLNRGRKLSLVLLNDAPGGNGLATAAQAGNGFLMERGYTIVWAGWQGDVAAGDGRMTFAPPVVPGITGRTREEFVFDNTANPAAASLTYPVADLAHPGARLSVREHADDERASPPGLAVTFASATQVSITRPSGYDAGAIYELVYEAKDPKVMGLGFAVARDVVSFLKHGSSSDGNPLAATRFDYAVGFGISQSGRYLRDFLYQGFNEDEAGRVVFEALMPHIGGSKKTFINARFAQPGRQSQQHSENAFPGDQFPFTYAVLKDPISGRTDGLLARCLARNNCPKIMQTDSGLEVYQSRASLVVTDPSGAAIDLPENVRVYLMANVPHFAPANAMPSTNAVCEQPLNPLHAGAPMRALLVAMDGWVTGGGAPPPSRYPSRRDGTLVAPDKSAVGFPAIPGFAYVGLINRLTLVDHATMPPTKGAGYAVFVGKTDADGHDAAGIRLPALDAPVATYESWNFRKEGFAAGDLCDLSGSTLPLAATREERLARQDPRRSLAERYPTPGDYVAAVSASTERLVQDRLMLPADAKRLVEDASRNRANGTPR